MNLPDTKKIDSEIEQAVYIADKIELNSKEAFTDASEFLKSIKALIKSVKDTFSEPKQKAWEAHKSITNAEKKHLSPLEKAEVIVKKKMGSYVQEQERLARIERERLEAEAKKRDEERRILEAEALAENGQSEEAEAILEEESEIVVPMERAVEKQGGISYVENWTFEIKDVNQIPRQFMIPDEKKIRQYIKAMKGESNIPGVRVYSEKTVRVA